MMWDAKMRLQISSNQPWFDKLIRSLCNFQTINYFPHPKIFQLNCINGLVQNVNSSTLFVVRIVIYLWFVIHNGNAVIQIYKRNFKTKVVQPSIAIIRQKCEMGAKKTANRLMQKEKNSCHWFELSGKSLINSQWLLLFTKQCNCVCVCVLPFFFSVFVPWSKRSEQLV